MSKIGDEGGKNADSRSDANTTGDSDLDALDNIPDPVDSDFLDIIGQEERKFYLQKFDDLKRVKAAKLHCTACDKHLGLLTRHTNRYRMHPLLRSLVCISCQDFYNSGEFEKGEDGSELYCRWCGQGGQVYCCSSCPVVFCEKCIKRNFGVQKINEIESNDDWQCFVCNPKPLWLHRARYWVLILYCNFKNKQAQSCTDSALKVILLRKCQVDESECCKRNIIRQRTPAIIDKRKSLPEIKKCILPELKKCIVPEVAKTPEQKKTISINEARQAIKRLGSPVSIKKVTVPATPIQPVAVPSAVQPVVKVGIPQLSSCQLSINPVHSYGGKRMRMSAPVAVQSLPPPLVSRFSANSLTVRPEKKQQPQRKPPMNVYNGYIQPVYTVPMRDVYANVLNNDNLNLSLDSLTQGIEVAALPNMSSQDEEDAVVCTPDMPMDTAEDIVEEPPKEVPCKPDDDVQCLTPTPKIVPKPLSALTEPKQRQYPAVLPSTAFSNIIQMTENDVTINEATGGLKFKVDPSTLSSSKMYKLPDGRIFAVNNNPKMPGGYSATIVAIDEASLARSGLAQGRSQRLQQRLQRQIKQPPTPPPKLHSWTTPVITKKKASSNTPTSSSPRISSTASLAPAKLSSTVDTTAPAGSVEWFKFNVVDAIDIMNYVLQKLNKLKNSSQELRTKSIDDVKEMHQNFEQTLKTSCKRFEEVRETLNQGYKNWLKEKNCSDILSDDEDEVQILSSEDAPTVQKLDLSAKHSVNDEPIFIDENSNDSLKNTTCQDDGEVVASVDLDSSNKGEDLDSSNKSEDLVSPNKGGDMHTSNKAEVTDSSHKGEEEMHNSQKDDEMDISKKDEENDSANLSKVTEDCNESADTGNKNSAEESRHTYNKDEIKNDNENDKHDNELKKNKDENNVDDNICIEKNNEQHRNNESLDSAEDTAKQADESSSEQSKNEIISSSLIHVDEPIPQDIQDDEKESQPPEAHEVADKQDKTNQVLSNGKCSPDTNKEASNSEEVVPEDVGVDLTNKPSACGEKMNMDVDPGSTGP